MQGYRDATGKEIEEMFSEPMLKGWHALKQECLQGKVSVYVGQVMPLMGVDDPAHGIMFDFEKKDGCAEVLPYNLKCVHRKGKYSLFMSLP